MGHIVAMLNQKGGVGKTSTCHHLAGTMAKMGRRVLLVDNDPQSSLTQGFWGPDALHRIDPVETIVALYNPDVLPRVRPLIHVDCSGPTGYPWGTGTSPTLAPGSPTPCPPPPSSTAPTAPSSSKSRSPTSRPCL